ncbi:prepilin-type N-terminal cleavage/methylation domain-containing protein [Pseudoalteromonas sp. CO325X]|uniref:pilin n=1 Tax=Pseudoalteromonas sp. CO325X TaxID=1777262 RepID=UPI001023A010|nr:pilin [Pseudoalteromonas sp. CO325X]RZF87959.1 prepilin-type N-terminal cleavage/methylation domain-containing protein [Pseudoalteromonas sp. CO325X]
MEKMTQNKQQGFTLIELMIVVAIIGILAAVALPAYQDYTVRAKMAEVLVQAGAHKNSVSEYYQSENKLPADAAAAGVDFNSIASTYITAVTAAGGVLTYTVDVDGKAKGELILTPSTKNNSLTWKCSTNGIETKYLPANCR